LFFCHKLKSLVQHECCIKSQSKKTKKPGFAKPAGKRMKITNIKKQITAMPVNVGKVDFIISQA